MPAEQLQYGLTPLPPDERDYSLGALYTLPELITLPKEFRLPARVKHQKDSDFCSAYASCAVSEVQEEIELEPAYSFAVSKEIQGDVDGWGCDLRTAMKAHCAPYGALPKELSPYSLENKSADFLRRLENWPVPLSQVKPYRKKSYFKITGQYDHFDNIRASLFKFLTPVEIGIDFGYPLRQIYLENVVNGTGHAMTVIGWTATHLIVLNSYGREAGDGGVHYISRNVINHFVPQYGAFSFVDIDQEEAKTYLKAKIKVDQSWIIRKLLYILWKLNIT